MHYERIISICLPDSLPKLFMEAEQRHLNSTFLVNFNNKTLCYQQPPPCYTLKPLY